ncbi:MAG: hypothetical protein ACLP5H_19475 [Desulfomonilaceae bacterium]
MSKPRLSAKEILADIRAGMDDAALMGKYDLSAQGLQSALTKLVAAGVMKQAELDDRGISQEQTVNLPWKCPACGKPQPKEFEECPQCGVIVRKLNSDTARPATTRNAEQVTLGRAILLGGVALLLLLGVLGVRWYHKVVAAEERRVEAVRLQRFERTEEQRRGEAKAKEFALQQDEIHRQREAERLEKESQSQQNKETEEWRKQEEELVRKEQKKQQDQKSQQAAKEKQTRQRVIRAYLNIMRVTRNMTISLIGEDVLRAIPLLKARSGEFADRLLELKTTPGADPLVVGHFDRAFRHLLAAFKGRSRKEKYDSLRMWREECRRAFAQIKGAH